MLDYVNCIAKRVFKAGAVSMPFACVFASCAVTSRMYRVWGQDSNGNVLTKNLNLTAQGSGIYTTRNAVCRAAPQATGIIVDQETGKNLDSDSSCRCS